MSDLHRWQLQYLGTSTLPKNITVVELQAFFTYSETELAALRTRYKSDLRVAAAVQLGFLKMTGTPLETVLVIPPNLLRYVGKQLGARQLTIASLRALYKKRPRTLYEHQSWAMEQLGFSRATLKQFAHLLEYLRIEALVAPSVDALVERGMAWMYQRKFLYPGDRPIRDYARQALGASDEGLLKMIREAASGDTLREWELAALRTRPGTGGSNLEWLQEAPRRNSATALRETIDRIEFLKKLGVHKLDLPGVPIEKIRIYSSEVRHVRPAKFREMKDPGRTLRLVCFLKMALMSATDIAILMGNKQIQRILRHAHDDARLLDVERRQSAEERLQQIFSMEENPDVSDKEFREFVRRLKTGGPTAKFRTRAEAVRWMLSEPNPTLRSLLAEIQKLDLSASPEEGTLQALGFIQALHRAGATKLPPPGESPVPYAHPWSKLIEGPDRERALRALEAATLLAIRKSLRSGSVWVDHSENFRGRESLLISRERWEAERNRRYDQLRVPQRPDDRLNAMLHALSEKLERVDKAVRDGEITIDDQVHLPRLKALPTQPEVNQKRDALFKQVGVVQFPELILEVDGFTGFSKQILGRAAHTSLELLQVYSGMLAHGCSLDASSVALMIPQLKTSQILSGMQLFEDRHTIRNANEAVVSFQKHLAVAGIWGNGSLASADMMSLDVSKIVWAARQDPKRGVPSIGTYTHYSDFRSVIYDQPIVLNERQAGAAIEGAIRQKEFEVLVLAVDTHGYTDFAMGIAKLLGFDLCPRLKRLSEKKLFVPPRFPVPESLQAITHKNVNLDIIRKNWDELVRLAASIDTGQTTATIALARFGSSAAEHPVYQAGVHFGRLVRSLFLCDYFTSEDFRRTINRILVHGESVHQLQRAIYMGAFSKPRGQREEELFAISGSLTLMTNLCLAWTANRIETIFHDQLHSAVSREELSWLSFVSPAHFSNINFRGTFTFPIERYKDRVIEPARWAA